MSSAPTVPSPAGLIQWFDDRDGLAAAMASLVDADRLAIDALTPRERFGGFCPACHRAVSFQVTGGGEAPGDWRNLLEGMICDCGTNGRTRVATLAWREVRASLQPRKTLIFERVTPLFARMAQEDSQLEGCEYLGPERTPGETYDYQGIPVRHEDMLALSCADDSLDLIMHFDVLEHVPDHRAALRECYRALRSGGRMLFTLPFYSGLDRHIVRAEFKGGQVVRHLPDAFHGNPVGDGALVFIHPGMELLEDLAAAGFETSVGLTHSIGFGIVSNGCPFPDGHMWPVIFLATKS